MTDHHGSQNSSPQIGEKLKTLRKSRGYSIRLLAEKAGLSPNTISLIESSATSPTVATLQNIANVLEIPLSAFFMHEEPESEIVLIRAQDHNHPLGQDLRVSVFPSQILDQRVRVMRLTISPGAGCGPEPLAHPGDELVICLHGTLEYTVKGQTYFLEEQDSLSFKAHLPHRWYNPGQEDVHFMILITTETDQSFRSHLVPTP